MLKTILGGAAAIAVALLLALPAPAQSPTGPRVPLAAESARGVQEHPVYIHDEAVARYTLYLVLATIVLAAVAVFQDTFRGWFYKPKFHVAVKTALPDCVRVSIFSTATGEVKAEGLFLGMWITNSGNVTARNVQVFARQVQRERSDGQWDLVEAFPPINLVWAHLNKVDMPMIPPGTSRRCALAHITRPSQRAAIGEDAKHLKDADAAALAFDIAAPPSHLGHIVGPGTYRVVLEISAENSSAPLLSTIQIKLPGSWHEDLSEMLRDGVGLKIV